MPRFVSLSEFMPYGAPDLLAAAPRDLTRALAASCGIALAAFALATLIPAAPHSQPTVLLPTIVDIGPQPLVQLETPQRPVARLPSTPVSARGDILPVPDASPSQVPSNPSTSGPTDADRGGPPTVKSEGTSRTEPPPPSDIVPWTYVDELPVVIHEVRAEYPDFAIQAGIEGTVVVKMLIGADGRVSRAEPDQRRTVMVLEAAAVEAAKRWVFKPATTNGKPVPVWIALPFRFKLH